MQHGPQVMGNSGYANWEDLPQKGYNVLPDFYWVWDHQSKQNIDSWVDKTTRHKAILGGNPWCEYWNDQPSTIESTENEILYSLQPLPTEVLFPDFLVDFIKKEKSYAWKLRYHPRQQPLHIKEIETFLKQRNILDLLTIEDAIQTPLPLSITKAKVGITNYSGVVLEAAYFGKPSIILHPLGEIAFSQLIDDGKAVFLKDSSQLKSVLERLINHETTQVNHPLSKSIFTDLVKSHFKTEVKRN